MKDSVYTLNQGDIESLTKIVKISGSIETIRMSQHFSNGMQTFANYDMCLAIAENKSLKTLYLSTLGQKLAYNTDFPWAIAINAKTGGSLENLYLSNSLNPQDMQYYFFPSMYLSDKDEATWKRNYEEANAMEKHQLDPKFYCNLKNISFAKNGWQ